MHSGQLQWSLELSVGVNELDDAHRELVDLYNRISWACENDGGVEAVRERIRTFLTYARWHFDQEEAFMQQMHYPGYLDHKTDHQRLLQDAADFVESVGALGGGDCAAIAKYFKFWLTRHMAQKDGTLRLYLRPPQSVLPESRG